MTGEEEMRRANSFRDMARRRSADSVDRRAQSEIIDMQNGEDNDEAIVGGARSGGRGGGKGAKGGGKGKKRRSSVVVRAKNSIVAAVKVVQVRTMREDECGRTMKE
jgi:hypothetical protein